MIDRGTLWAAALEDLGSRCSVDTTLDVAYVKERIAREGESFLTTSLPQFGKDFELALEDLTISPTMFAGFGRRNRRLNSLDSSDRIELRGGIPKFLQGFVSLVFDDSYDVTRDELLNLRGIVKRTNDARRKAAEDCPNPEGVSAAPVFVQDLLPPLAIPVSGCNERELAMMADAIAAVRQLCLMFGKEKSVCSQPFVDKAVEEFVRTDEELIDPFSTEE